MAITSCSAKPSPGTMGGPISCLEKFLDAFPWVTPRVTAAPAALPIALGLSRRGLRSTGLVLYQMAAYLSRFAPTNIPRFWGALIYPQLATPVSVPLAEQFGPWSFSGGKKMAFVTLPHQSSDAVGKLRSLITSMTCAVGASATW